MTNINLKLIETYYDEAKTKVNERYYVDKNYLRQGLYEQFYENGQLRRRCTYKDGKLNGLYKSFHENGKLEERFTFKNDELDGLYELFYENGN